MKLFEIVPCGDPYNRSGYDVREYERSFSDDVCVFRGDLSPAQGRVATTRMLRRLYPGCRIKQS